MIQIEKNIPPPANATLTPNKGKDALFSMLDEMQVGDSFRLDGYMNRINTMKYVRKYVAGTRKQFISRQIQGEVHNYRCWRIK